MSALFSLAGLQFSQVPQTQSKQVCDGSQIYGLIFTCSDPDLAKHQTCPTQPKSMGQAGSEGERIACEPVEDEMARPAPQPSTQL